MNTRRAGWIGFGAGIVASALMGVVMLLLRMEAGVPTYPELIGNALAAHVPIPLFNFSTSTLGTETKPTLFALLTAIMVLVGGLIGIGYARRYRPGAFWRNALLPALRIGAIAWLVVMFVLSPVVGAGFGGASLRNGPTPYFLAGLLLFGLYAVALAVMTAALHRAFAPPGEVADVDEGRRALLHNVAIGATLLSLGTLALMVRRFAFPSRATPATPAQPSAAQQQAETIAQAARAQAGAATDPAFALVAGKLPDEVTDADHFYLISKNFSDPTVHEEGWHITVDGLVERSLTLTYADLLALPSVTFLRTMECISNHVGEDLISNGQWTGVPLRTVLQQAGVRPGTIKAEFTCDDGYSTAIPLDEAMAERTILAYQLNGAPLPRRHGFPARLIFPAHYGMKNPKWITGIHLTADDYQGYWERQGWTDTAIVQTMSRIDTPTRHDTPAAGVATGIGGIAYAGDRGISRVEVSTDGGRTWNDAALAPPLGPLTWVFWAYQWTPPAPGTYGLAVRATDGTGTLQEYTQRAPIPDGATGYDRVTATVKA